MSSAAALSWFARHEIRLAWREWLAMMTAGRKGRKRAAIIGLIVFAAIMHLPAYAVIGRFADLQAPLEKSTLIGMSATIFLAWALMLSQAIESGTRGFYARADLDLIMSSPVRLAHGFSVRIAAIALSLVAGARGARRWRSAAASPGRRSHLARRGDGDFLAAVCRHHRQGFGERGAGASRRPHQSVSRRLAATGAAVEGIRAAAARPVAGVADADAAALSGAAGLDAVAKFRREFRRHRADHAGDGDGGGPARWRSRLAGHIGRRRRRPRGDRAPAALARDPRQDRSGVDRDRRDLRAADCRADLRLAVPGGGHRFRCHHRGGFRHRDTVMVSGTGAAQPVSPPPDIVPAGDIRGSLFLDRLGRDRRLGAVDPDRRARYRIDDRLHPRSSVEDQPAARVIGGSVFSGRHGVSARLLIRYFLPYAHFKMSSP